MNRTNLTLPTPLKLAILFAISGLVASIASSALSADIPPHDCQDNRCKRFLWIDWCSGDGHGQQTFCDLDHQDHDCLTSPCGHS